MRDWCGGFLLHGSHSISSLLNWNVPYTFGSFDSDSFCEHEGSSVGAYAVSNNASRILPVPNRNTTLLQWNSSDSIDAQIDRFINLNKQERHQTTYTETLANRVFVDKGIWSTTLMVVSKQPSIVMACRGCSMYMWLVRFRGSFYLMWSTDPNHMEQSLQMLPEDKQDEFFGVPFTVTDAICVIHPVYLLGRFHRAWYKMFLTDRLSVVSYMRRYINKRIQPL